MKHLLSLILAVFLLCNLALPANAMLTFPEFLLKTRTAVKDEYCNNTIYIRSDWLYDMGLDTEGRPITYITMLPESRAAENDWSVTVKYQGMDYWSTMGEEYQKNLPRSEFDNDLFSKADLARYMDVDEESITMVDINGIEYFQVTNTITTSIGSFGAFKVTKVESIYLMRFYNGYFYIYGFNADTSNELYGEFIDIVKSATYDGASSDSTDSTSDSDTYESAKNAYNKGNYNEAKKLFEKVSNYKDTEKYLRLIKIRNYGCNIGMGTRAYKDSNALTVSQKKEIDKAMNHVDFADTAEVLMCNSDVACYFLLGEWYTGAGAPRYSYLKVKTNTSSGYRYWRSTNLSTSMSQTFSINDGLFTVDIFNQNTAKLNISILTRDSIEVYSYESGLTFIFYRD